MDTDRFYSAEDLYEDECKYHAEQEAPDLRASMNDFLKVAEVEDVAAIFAIMEAM